MILVAYILTEWKNPESKFKNYFDTMPQTYDEFPICFTDELYELVKGTNLHGMAKRREKEYTEKYEFFQNLIPEFIFSKKYFFAACILV